MTSCVESVGNKVESSIGSFFAIIGLTIGKVPRKTIVGCIVLTALCGIGFLGWSTESRPERLWVPQNTVRLF